MDKPTISQIIALLSIRYAPALLREILEGDQLFMVEESYFGPVTGISERERRPIAFDLVSHLGEPQTAVPHQVSIWPMFGCRVSQVIEIDLRPGDCCYLDYTSDHPDDPEDQSGFYRVNVLAVRAKQATVSYVNHPYAGKVTVTYDKLIARLTPGPAVPKGHDGVDWVI